MSDDKGLGMNCPISRRDFLNGVALSIGNVLIPPSALAFDEPGYAPEKALIVTHKSMRWTPGVTEALGCRFWQWP